MAVLRDPDYLDSSISYLSALSVLCAVSCFVTMLKFGGFKATLNFVSRSKNKEREEPALPMIGAYRISRDDFFGYDNLSEPPKKVSPTTIVPPNQPQLRPNKSTSDLDNYVPVQVRQTGNIVSTNPRGEEEPRRINPKEAKKCEKEQKRAQKQRVTEQIAREKAAIEATKQERRTEKVSKEAQKPTKEKRGKKKNPAPQPVRANPLSQVPYSTNTLESSISKSSGPPPYTETVDVARIKTDNSDQVTLSENVTISKPIDTGGDWDMITQHRQQITRPTPTANRQQTKRTVMDLNYNFGPTEGSDGNSEV